jgi:hypothetical protein
MSKTKPSKRRLDSVPYTDEKLRAALHDNTGGVNLGDAALGSAAEVRIASGMPATPAITSGVSLCMIVKNEESNIAACLESVRDLVDEIIVVDTGSTDATKSIAAGFGGNVFDFQWVDDFAAARNESIRHATREWIFWMDADERLNEENRGKLRAFFGQLPQANVAYVMECVSSFGMSSGGKTVDTDVRRRVRVFRNDPRIRWRYRVHEEIIEDVIQVASDCRPSGVVIRHIGYEDPNDIPPKLKRNLRLLQLENLEHPGNALTLFNLGRTLFGLGQIAEAVPCLQESLTLYHPIFSLSERKLDCRVLLSRCYAGLSQSEQASQVFREGL